MNHSPCFSTMECGFLRIGWSVSSETPITCFFSPLPLFRPASVVAVAFGRNRMPRGCAYGPSVEGRAGDGRSRGGEREDWVFGPAVVQLSMRDVTIITLVTMVEFAGEGWAHISWAFIMAQGSIEYIVI